MDFLVLVVIEKPVQHSPKPAREEGEQAYGCPGCPGRDEFINALEKFVSIWYGRTRGHTAYQASKPRRTSDEAPVFLYLGNSLH